MHLVSLKKTPVRRIQTAQEVCLDMHENLHFWHRPKHNGYGSILQEKYVSGVWKVQNSPIYGEVHDRLPSRPPLSHPHVLCAASDFGGHDTPGCNRKRFSPLSNLFPTSLLSPRHCIRYIPMAKQNWESIHADLYKHFKMASVILLMHPNSA